jgi:hypothetical protein
MNLPLALTAQKRYRQLLTECTGGPHQQVKGPPGARRNDMSAEMRRLREENAALRQQVTRAEGARSLAGEMEQLSTELKETHQELRLVRNGNTTGRRGRRGVGLGTP